MRRAMGLIAAGLQTLACGAPPHYRIIASGQWNNGPATVLANGDVIYQPEWSALERWSNGETTTVLKPGQLVDGSPTWFHFNNPYRWAAAGDGGVFAECSSGSDFHGLLAMIPGRKSVWWLKPGDEIPGVGTWNEGQDYGFAPSTSARVFTAGSARYSTEDIPEGGGILLSLVADDSDRGRRIEVIAKEGDRTPDASERFGAGFGGFWPAFGFVFPDEHNRMMLVANVRSKPESIDPAGRQTLWRWTESRGLERLLDPKIANVDGWAATPIINAFMSRGGVFAILATLTKPGETSRNAILVFDDFETNLPRIAVMEGEVLAEGTIGRLLQVTVNESGSIAFGAYFVRPGSSLLTEALIIHHRTRAGETKLVFSPFDCKPEMCFLEVLLTRMPQLTEDERVVFSATDWVANFHALFEFDAQGGGLRRITPPTATENRWYPALLGGEDAPFTLRWSNSAGRVVVGDNVIGYAIYDRSITPCPADLTCDGLVDLDDFREFLPQYQMLDCGCDAMPFQCDADLNTDGAVDDRDFVVFVAAYEALKCE